MDKKQILVIQTGGTISMENDPNTRKSIISQINNDAIQAIGEQLNDVLLTPIFFSNLPSPSMTIKRLFELADLIEKNLSKDEVTGIVVSHGTDTLDESAYFIDLKIQSEKPIVFTGSMRNKSELGYDGVSNLYSACLVASVPESKNKGVLVVLNDEINAASEVTKTHTISRDTFKSLEFGALGVVDNDEVIYYRSIPNNDRKLNNTHQLSNVEIVKSYIDSKSNIIDFLIKSGLQGLVIEALGRGNIPPCMVPGIERAIENGITVVVTSRCPSGRVVDNYDYPGGGFRLKQLGVKFAGNLSSQKARIKLILEGKNFTI